MNFLDGIAVGAVGASLAWTLLAWFGERFFGGR